MILRGVFFLLNQIAIAVETFYLLSGSDILTDENGDRITVEGA